MTQSKTIRFMWKGKAGYISKLKAGKSDEEALAEILIEYKEEQEDIDKIYLKDWYVRGVKDEVASAYFFLNKNRSKGIKDIFESENICFYKSALSAWTAIREVCMTR